MELIDLQERDEFEFESWSDRERDQYFNIYIFTLYTQLYHLIKQIIRTNIKTHQLNVYIYICLATIQYSQSSGGSNGSSGGDGGVVIWWRSLTFSSQSPTSRPDLGRKKRGLKCGAVDPILQKLLLSPFLRDPNLPGYGNTVALQPLPTALLGCDGGRDDVELLVINMISCLMWWFLAI